MRPIIASSAAVLLAACTTAGGGAGGYQSEYQELMAECRAQGGILTPIPGAQTGDPATEYACERRSGGALVN